MGKGNRGRDRVPGPKRLSVCLLVKDEEQFLRKCLESVRGLADQIVVVDNDSSDSSPQIAAELGAEVHIFGKVDDFGAGRNEALRHATGDWVLVLDGDEWLDPRSHDEVRRLIQTGGFVGYVVRILNYTKPEGTDSVFESRTLRLFPNHPDLRFVGRDPHTQLHSKEEPLPIVLCEVIVHHEGYRPQVMESRDKLARNARLLEREVHDYPAEPFHAFNLGLTYAAMKRNGEAERELQRAVELNLSNEDRSRPDYLSSAYLALALAIYPQGRLDEVIAHCQRALELDPHMANAHLVLGSALLSLGRSDEALSPLKRAHRLAPESDQVSKSLARARRETRSIHWRPRMKRTRGAG